MKMVNKMPSYNEFKSMVLNKGYDVDGYYGNQCWDGYAKYCQYLGYGIAHCTNTGYVRDLWELRKTNGMLNYFNEINVMQAGDVAVFKEVAGWTPLSHVAIFDHDAGGGFGWFLGQNQGGYNGAFNLVKLPYSAIYDTAFRPKCFVAQPKSTKIEYKAHVQGSGWSRSVADGSQAGTTGKSKRIEAIQITKLPCALKVKAHIQDVGTKDYGSINTNTIIGTTGKSKRLEAIYLEGKVYAQVHIQGSGWSAKSDCSDGMWFGTKGMSKRIEAIRLWSK